MAQTDYSNNNLKSAIENNEVKDVYSILLENDKDLFIDIKNNIFKLKELQEDVSEKHICGAGNNTLFISAAGKVSPCATWQAFELGDLKKESLYDIYYNNKEIKELRGIKVKDFPEYTNSPYGPFIKVCPAHNANTHKGDYRKIPEDVFINAKLQYETAKEFFNKK